jgi:hypothetical protein
MKKAFQEMIKLTNDEVVTIKTCITCLTIHLKAISAMTTISIVATQNNKRSIFIKHISLCNRHTLPPGACYSCGK